jgi:hypothetical protein
VANTKSGGTLGNMSLKKRQEVQSKGGRASHEKGAAPEFTAGAKGSGRRAAIKSWKLRPKRNLPPLSSEEAQKRALSRWRETYKHLLSPVITPQLMIPIGECALLLAVNKIAFRRWRKQGLFTGVVIRGQKKYLPYERLEMGRRAVVRFYKIKP